MRVCECLCVDLCLYVCGGVILVYEGMHSVVCELAACARICMCMGVHLHLHVEVCFCCGPLFVCADVLLLDSASCVYVPWLLHACNSHRL
jgi:hypothetical protein